MQEINNFPCTGKSESLNTAAIPAAGDAFESFPSLGKYLCGGSGFLLMGFFYRSYKFYIDVYLLSSVIRHQNSFYRPAMRHLFTQNDFREIK